MWLALLLGLADAAAPAGDAGGEAGAHPRQPGAVRRGTPGQGGAGPPRKVTHRAQSTSVTPAVQAPKAKLKVALKTFRGGATKATEAKLALGGAASEAVPLDAGALEKPLPDPFCDRAVLAVKGTDGQPELRWKLRLGHLGRIES